MTIIFGAQGVSPTFRGQPGNEINLQPGQTMLIPAGTWEVCCGLYSCWQQYDPLTTTWRTVGGASSGKMNRYVNSDGVNQRIANQTGCVVAAQVTNAGSGYLSPPTVTDNGGGGVSYLAILGPVVSTSVTVTNGGKNYTYPPIVQIQAPSSPGVQATAYSTISGGAVTSITIVDQGANYNFVPVITLTNDPRDTTGVGAAATATTTGANTVAAIVVTNHGTPITSTSTVPTITITAVNGGTSATAVPIMDWTITAYTVTSAGSGYVGGVAVSALGNGYGGAASAYLNPAIQTGIEQPRPALLIATITTGAIVTTGQTVLDGGLYEGAGAAQIIYGSFTGTSASVGNVGFTFGGQADTVLLNAV